MQFDHEKLDVYKAGLEFNRFVTGLLEQVKETPGYVRDQLGRASLSIALNIAEGNGKRSTVDRKRFFEIARGSAMECAAVLDILAVLGARTEEEIMPGKALLYRIVSMLTRMTEPREAAVRVREASAVYGEDEGFDYEHEHEHEKIRDHEYDDEHEHE
jgi:four helix bundle protein